MGKPGRGNLCQHGVNEIASCGEPGELKHLSTRRKRKKTSISRVAASEMEGAQTMVRASWGSDCNMADVR